MEGGRDSISMQFHSPETVTCNAMPPERSIMQTLKDLPGDYKKWVIQYPEQVSRLESALKVVAYFIPMKLGLQQEYIELVYATTNFLSFVNDRILAKHYNIRDKVDSFKGAVKKAVYALSVLDLAEVAIELFVQSKTSEGAKWLIVYFIVIIRCALQVWLVFGKKYGILTSPPVGVVNRTRLGAGSTDGGEAGHQHQQPGQQAPGHQGWRGPRTRRVIRSLHGDPSVPYEDLIPEGDARLPPATKETKLSPTQILAECLHIARPLVHVTSMFAFGQTAWSPWLLSVAMDVASLQLMGKMSSFRKDERKELSRRKIVFLLYLLRSPFYDNVFKVHILRFLKYLSGKLPLVHYILDPVLEYLPVWQKIYFYNWML